MMEDHAAEYGIAAFDVGQTPFPMASLPLIDKLSLAQSRIVLQMARLQWGFDRPHCEVQVSIRDLADKCGISVRACHEALSEMAGPMPERGIDSAILSVDAHVRRTGRYSLTIPGASAIHAASATTCYISLLAIPNDFFDLWVPRRDLRHLDIRIFLRLRLMIQAGLKKWAFTAERLNEEPLVCYQGTVRIPPLNHWRVSRVRESLNKWVEAGVIIVGDGCYGF